MVGLYNVTDMSLCFQMLKNPFTSDLSSWIVSNVTDIEKMFDNAQSFESIKYVGFITPSNLTLWDV